jgi:hypothetical protein
MHFDVFDLTYLLLVSFSHNLYGNTELAEFLSKNQISLFDSLNNYKHKELCVLVPASHYNVSTAESAVLTALSYGGWGITFLSEDGQAEKHVRFQNLYANQSVLGFGVKHFMAEANDYAEAVAAYQEVLNTATIVDVKELFNFFYLHICSDLDKISDADIASILCLLCSGERKDNVVVMPANNGGYSVEVDSLCLTGPNGLEKKAVSTISVKGKAMSSRSAFLLLALQIFCLDEADLYKVPALISAVPGLWETDTDYGVTGNDASLELKKGASASIAFVQDKEGFKFPYMNLQNAEMDPGQVEFDRVVLMDKNAKRAFYSEAAANACGIFAASVVPAPDMPLLKGQWTLNDTGVKLNKKAKKLEAGAKALNRVTQSWKLQYADLVDKNTGKSLRTVSKFGMRLCTGEVRYVEGQLVDVGVAKMSLGSGSGVAFMHPDFALTYSLPKTKKGLVSFKDCTGEVLEKYQAIVSPNHEGFFAFLSDIEKTLEAIPQDKIFEPGDIVASFDYGSGNVRPLFTNDLDNQKFVVIGSKVKKPLIRGKDYKPDHVSIQLKIKVIKTGQYSKLRAYGSKATTFSSANYAWFDESGNSVPCPANVIYNNETRKGNGMELSLYAHQDWIKKAYGWGDDSGCHLIVEGVNPVDNKKIDLTDPFNEVNEWVQKTTKRMKVQVWMAEDEYAFSAFAAETAKERDPSYEFTWRVVDTKPGMVLVEEDIEILVGKCALNFEISTADESVTTSELTPEMMAGMYLVCPKLVESLYAEALPVRAALLGLVRMAKMESSTAFKVLTKNQKDLAAFQERIATVCPNLNGVKDADFLAILDQAFEPEGGDLRIKAQSFGEGDVQMVINIKTIRSTMTFISGTADQIAQEILGCLRFLATCKLDMKGLDSVTYNLVSRLGKSLTSWIGEALRSKGLLKKMSRSSKCLVGGKVRSIYDPRLQSDEDGLPKVMVNPECAITKRLCKNADGSWNERYVDSIVLDTKEELEAFKANKEVKVLKVKKIENDVHIVSHECVDGEQMTVYKKYFKYEVLFVDFNLLEGSVVTAQRIPMFMPVFCKVVLAKDIETSHVAILPSVWAQGNSGDSDGDGIGLINASIRSITIEEAVKANQSPMGLAGYVELYRHSKIPFADFIESPNKKSLIRSSGQVYATFLPHHTCNEFVDENTGHIGLIQTHINVRSHYMFNVGTGYGIASALTCWAALMAQNPYWAKDTAKMQAIQKAVMISWVLIYEGLGLSGYTAAAKEFFDVLRCSSYSLWRENNLNPHVFVEFGGRILPIFADEVKDLVKSKSIEVQDGLEYMLKALDLPVDSLEWREAMTQVCTFNHYRMKYVKIDGRRLSQEKIDKLSQEALTRISMVGLFRHMGRGFDPNTELALRDYDEQGYSSDEFQSSLQLVQDGNYHMDLIRSDCWMSKLYRNGIRLMQNAKDILIAAKEAEFDMDFDY